MKREPANTNKLINRKMDEKKIKPFNGKAIIIYLTVKAMDRKTLKQNYENACNAYLEAFCKKHGFDRADSYWIGDRTGEIADVADYCADMSTIIDDIELDVPEEEFLEWYDYCTEMHFLGAETAPNFRSWVKGCPRRSKEEIEELRRLHQNVADAKDMLEKLLRNKNIRS